MDTEEISCELEKAIRGINGVGYFRKGKRGLIFTAEMDGERIAIKVTRDDSTAINRIGIESDNLRILNRSSIGPKMIGNGTLRDGTQYLVYRFVDGKTIEEFLKTATRDQLKAVILSTIDKCFELDKLGITKEEMHRPFKHIIVSADLGCELIDFERAHHSESPKNVRQFIQFIQRKEISSIFIVKGPERLIGLGKEYKKGIEAFLQDGDMEGLDRTFRSIRDMIKNS